VKYHPKLKLFYTISLSCIICFYQQIAHAQDNSISPKNHQYQDIDAYSAFLNKTLADNAAALDKSIRKDYTKIITEKNTGLIKSLKENDFLFDADTYPYLNAIFNHILEKNGLDKTQYHFFVDRTSSVNAYSYEDGTIVCNLGLVDIMENESQLAMVFCHELGHYLLKHVNNSIVGQLEKYNSPEFLAQIKKIKKQEYNVNKQLEQLLTVDVFNRRKHNRGQERAADSLALILFNKTAYNGTNVSRIFDLLAASENSPNAGALKSFFKNENIAIDEEWLKPTKRMTFGSVKKEIVDSLKTHPDCSVRKITMQVWYDKHPKTGADYLIANAQKLESVKKIAYFDAAAHAKEKDDLGYYFYQLILVNTLYPANKVIKSEIFDTLVSLGKHQKEHTLHTVVTTQYIPDDDADEYALLLKFFDSVDLDSLTAIATKYYTNNKSYIPASDEAINNLAQLKY